jgi:glycosyltransferase involved in cell wall biosynthesis
MRVAILSNTFPPDGRGGAERIAALQADALVARGHEVQVWAAQSSETMESDREDVHRFASSVWQLESMKLFHRFLFHLMDLQAHSHVVGSILTWKPDVIISHNLTGCGFQTPSNIQRHGVRWIHVLHDVQLYEPSGQVRADRGERLYERIWRGWWGALRHSVFGKPDVLVSPSAWLLREHQRHHFTGVRNEVLPNPAEIDSLATSRAFHRPGTMAFVGRLSKEKGIGIFAEACRHLLHNGSVNRVIVAGDGPCRKELPVEPEIDVRGTVSSEEARAIIAEADLLIAPSRLAENQPTIILEAMAMGTPVIASDTEGARELLEGTDAPLIPWSGNATKVFVETATALIFDPKKMHAISHAMVERARARHDVSAYGEKLEGLMR